MVWPEGRGAGAGEGADEGAGAVRTTLWVTQCGKETHAYKSYGNWQVKLEGNKLCQIVAKEDR